MRKGNFGGRAAHVQWMSVHPVVLSTCGNALMLVVFFACLFFFSFLPLLSCVYFFFSGFPFNLVTCNHLHAPKSWYVCS
ncbi:hypothetical protein VTO42DRAFT_4999 [Malbranchea cinnamomea]